MIKTLFTVQLLELHGMCFFHLNFHPVYQSSHMRNEGIHQSVNRVVPWNHSLHLLCLCVFGQQIFNCKTLWGSCWFIMTLSVLYMKSIYSKHSSIVTLNSVQLMKCLERMGILEITIFQEYLLKYTSSIKRKTCAEFWEIHKTLRLYTNLILCRNDIYFNLLSDGYIPLMWKYTYKKKHIGWWIAKYKMWI